ncbi:putative Alpha-methylacyl-CoA racemase [Glarea lozoyensis 74030]|uniref:Putative Alpha-methylacyl-CoA racemase n=1 Tax=Glarea lozoyensis (strain ATCC 74030 / MF5533) TaxID=1104152 RepID=H0EPL0_GLAL7|nr:putative Alpha-methylacyl-CoA racemase [Glarea lozoyensis 74030]
MSAPPLTGLRVLEFAGLAPGLGLSGKGIEKTREDRNTWPELRESFTAIFLRKTRSDWEKVFDRTDACCTPVLDYKELESDTSREGDQRPAVTLRETPSFALSPSSSPRDPSTGQGNGVEGGSYTGAVLYPGEGGEKLLSQWLGWKRGKDFDVKDGGMVRKDTSKL